MNNTKTRDNLIEWVIENRGDFERLPSLLKQGRYLTPFMVMEYLAKEFPGCGIWWDREHAVHSPHRLTFVIQKSDAVMVRISAEKFRFSLHGIEATLGGTLRYAKKVLAERSSNPPLPHT